jgi:hypothetical protein
MLARDRRAAVVALAAATGCGFFQDLDGYVGPAHTMALADASPPPPPPDPMVAPLDASATVARLVVAGGDDGTNALASAEIAPIGQGGLDAWTASPRPFAPAAWSASAALPDALVVAGGKGSAAVHVGATDGGTLAWTEGPPLPVPVASHALAASASFVVVTGGVDADGAPLATVLVTRRAASGAFEPWATGPALGSAVARHASVAIGPLVLVLGGASATLLGRDAGPANTVLRAAFDGDAGLGAFAPATPLSSPRYDLCAVVAGARVYVLGGRTDAGALATAESLGVDPATRALEKAWRPATPLPTARARIACAASDARVYVAGGVDANGAVDRVDSAEILANGDLGAWTREPSLSVPRAGAAAAVLAR